MKSPYATLTLAFLMMGCDQNPSVDSASAEATLPKDLTPEEEAFLQDVRQAFNQRDISPMMERVHKEGVEDWWLDSERDYLKGVLEGGLGHLELIRIDPPRKEEEMMDGSIAEWSLPLKWELIVHQPSDDSMMKVSHTISLSDDDGRIVSVRQVAKGEEDRAQNP